MKNFHALFIGVDAYQRVTPLNGCVNDALMMFEYLNETVDRQAYNFQPNFLLSIHNKKADEYVQKFTGYGLNYTINAAENIPTRNNILGLLKGFQTKVAAGDVFFLFYAGHGSTEAAHPYFEEETGTLQTLVPRDARVVVNGKKTKDVLDKEVRFLLRKIWENGTDANPVEVIFIQDSCHSAGATRSDMDKALEEIAKVVFNEGAAETSGTEQAFEEPAEVDLGEMFGDVDGGGDDLFAELQDGFAMDEVSSDMMEGHAGLTEEEDALGEDGMQLNVNETKLASARMVVASREASVEPRAIEEFDFFDEEVKDAMRAYSNEEDDGLSSRSKVFLDTEKEEDKVRSVFIEEDDMESRGGLESRSAGNSGNTGKRASGKKPPFNVAYPEANHIHMSACGKAEYAYEVKYPSGQKGGVFTNTIISLLKKFEGNISYHDLFNAAKLHIDGQFKQSPSIYVKGNPSKRYERFLGGFIERKEGVYNLTYKPKQRQWRADVGAFLGLPILRLNESIPVKVLLDDQHAVDAEITYVLAESAVIEFSSSPAPAPTAKGLKVQIPTQYMSQQIPVYVEEQASYLAEDKIKKVMLDHKGSENSVYQLRMEKGKFRFYARANPSEYVELSQYQILNTDGLGYQLADIQLLVDANGAYTNYGIWSVLQTIFDSLTENPMSWIQMDFADGSSFLYDGAKFFTIDPNVDISSFFVPESKEVLSRFLNRYFEQQSEEGLLNLQSTTDYPNPFKSHLAGINLESFENHIEWSSKNHSKYTVRVVNAKYYVVKTAEPNKFLTKGTEGLDPKSVAKVLGYLRAISRWEMLYKLENPHPGSREMLNNLGLKFYARVNGKSSILTVTYSEQHKKFQWAQDGQPFDALTLNYTAINEFDMGYMGKMYISRASTIAEQTFFGVLYLDYNFGVQPQDGVGSTEFFPYTDTKKERINLDVNELKQLPGIFNLANEDARPTSVNTAIKFFIAFNRFDVSDWVQEAVPVPTDDDYKEELQAMRSVMGRKSNPRAGDCVVLTLPLILEIPDNLLPKTKDNNSFSIRGNV